MFDVFDAPVLVVPVVAACGRRRLSPQDLEGGTLGVLHAAALDDPSLEQKQLKIPSQIKNKDATGQGEDKQFLGFLATENGAILTLDKVKIDRHEGIILVIRAIYSGQAVVFSQKFAGRCGP